MIRWVMGLWVVVLICSINNAIIAEELTINLETNRYEITKTADGFDEISMEDFGNLLLPGKPMLPAKTYLVALPPGAAINSVQVEAISQIEIEGIYNISPAPLTLPMDHQKNLTKEAIEIYQKNEQSSRFSNKFYPEKCGWFEGKGGLGNVEFLRITFAPFSFHAQSGRLVFSPRAIATIDYTVPLKSLHSTKATGQKFRKATSDRRAAKLLYNYEHCKNWYPAQSKANNNSANYNYVIITTSELQSAVSALVAWKTNLGYSVNVVTTYWISSQYSGNDLPQRIRNFLKEKYDDWGIEYVLLVGDVNEIPMRVCYPRANSELDLTPTDYYYADLTGDWDSDGDGRYGEYGEDKVDWVPELFVGRIPWSNLATVQQICQKIVNFESDQGSWKKNSLLLGAISNYKNEDNSNLSRTDGAALMEKMKEFVYAAGGNSTTLYEKEGINPTSYACAAPLTHSNVFLTWTSGQYGIVNWWAHGTNVSSFRKWWSTDDGDNIPETVISNEITWEEIISTDDCAQLSNTSPALIFACSCNNGFPEDDNLAKAMLKQGSAGIVASSRVSWYSIGWSNKDHGGNASLDYYFFKYLLDDGNRMGEALFNAKVYYANHFMYNSWGWVCWQNMYDFNLFGDPSLCWAGLNPTTTNFSISGNILYGNSSRTVSIANLILSGSALNSMSVDDSGFYQFPYLQAGLDYIVTPECKPPLLNSCILSYDAALAARIALNMYPEATEEQQIAADVDKNGAVQLYDASLIAQYAAGLVTGPSNNKAGEWTFAPSQRSYRPLSSDAVHQNFQAIILGDVDFNWGENLIFEKNDILRKKYETNLTSEIAAGSTFYYPILRDNETKIMCFDIHLSYDTKIFEFDGLEKSDEVQNFEIFANDSDDGNLRIAGFNVEAKEVPKNYLSIIFKIIGIANEQGEIELVDYILNNEKSFLPSKKVRVSGDGSAVLPVQYNLHQNYPNPFNPSTTIGYEIPKSSFVSLTIFNVLGEKIRTLVDETKQAGRYSIFWDGKNETGSKAPSGLYFYQLQAEEFACTYKMVLEK